MLRNILFIISLLAFVASCTQNEDKTKPKPKNLLSKQKMIKILEEIHLTDAEVSERRYRSLDLAQKAFDSIERKIFKKHKITKKNYKKSYDYYAHHLSDLAEIYTKVEENISKKLEKQKKSDSLKQVKSKKP